MPQKPDAEIFKRGRFHNKPPFSKLNREISQLDLVRKLLFQRTPDATPAMNIPVYPIDAQALDAQRENDDVHIYRLGHSTILMKFGKDYWLTDPVFSKRASPSQLAGPKRFHQTPIAVADLPRLTGVVISHNHYDHLDRAAISQLIGKVDHFVCPLGVGKYLTSWGVPKDQITELGWWQSTQRGGTNITATPTQHFSGRGILDGNKSLWASYAFKHAGKSLFFGSDSGYFDGFKQINNQLGPFDITMLETGAYSSAWPDVHMTPEQTVQAHQDLGGGVLMPIHNSTFKLAFHPWREPLERVARLAAAADISLLTPQIGERAILGAPVLSNPWWDKSL